jgi:hypothetical protein
MQLRSTRSAHWLVSVSALLAGCGGEGGSGPATDHPFVVDSLVVPATSAEAVTVYGLDIDGKENDADRGVDNALGRTFATLSSMFGLDIGAAVAAGVDDGSILLLANLNSADLAAAEGAEIGMYLGANPTPAACDGADDEVCRNHLDGSGSFEISPDSPTDTVFVGSIESGSFAMGADEAPGRLTLPFPSLDGSAPVAVDLVGARISVGAVSEDGLADGILGGAIPVEDFEEIILPSFHQGLAAAVTADCTGTAPDCCTPESTGAQVVELFDGNDDCAVSFEEFRGNFLIGLLVNPDVDLFDEAGAYNPNTDGVLDSLSLGMGFSATTGTFAVP